MKTVTVGRLIQLLEGYGAVTPVQVEGCDCVEECVGVSLIGVHLVLRRDDGIYQSDKIVIDA